MGNVFKVRRSNYSINTNPFIDLEVARNKFYNAKLKQSGKIGLLQWSADSSPDYQEPSGACKSLDYLTKPHRELLWTLN